MSLLMASRCVHEDGSNRVCISVHFIQCWKAAPALNAFAVASIRALIHVGGNGPPGLISAFETNVFQLGFDASWELDFFGGKRRALEAATAEVKAGGEAVNDVLVSLLVLVRLCAQEAPLPERGRTLL